MSSELETAYPERAGKLAKQARKAACSAAGEHWRAATKAAADMRDLEIEVVNSLRLAGEKILEAAGRTQLFFSLEVKEFCRKEILPLLPPGMEINQIRACVQIASHIPRPIENREELRAARQDVQLAFQALGLVEVRRRTELQSPVVRNLFSDFVNRVSALKVAVAELEAEGPLKDWPAEKLEEMLETLTPLVELNERVKKIRLGIVEV